MENNNYIEYKNFNTQEMQRKITSLELLKQINIFREQEYRDKDNFDLLTEAEKKRGHYVNLEHKDLLKIIRDEFEDEIQEGKISLLFYKAKIGNGAEKEYPYYELTLDQAKQILMRESKFVRKAVIKYINKLENELKGKEKSLPTTYLEALEQLIITEKARLQLEQENKEVNKKLEYKQEIINGLTEDTKLQTQRQLLREIINMKGTFLIQTRWNLLYDFYNKVKKMKVRARCEGYNLKQMKQKDKLSVLGYIDEILGDIPTLYGLAVKLFESDFKDKLQKYMEAL